MSSRPLPSFAHTPNPAPATAGRRAEILADPGFGRFFTDQERLDRDSYLIINKHFAEQFFPGENPIGKHVTVGLLNSTYEIVGVVGDTVYDGSLKTQVKQLRARLRERCLNEIQRGRDRFSHPEGN